MIDIKLTIKRMRLIIIDYYERMRLKLENPKQITFNINIVHKFFYLLAKKLKQ